jgi:hypothetical protein
MRAHQRVNREALMKHLKCLLLCALLGSASMQAAASCYTVYDPSGVVYHESTPPVDMSQPLHETLPARFPGGHMIFDTDTDCSHIIVTATTRSLSSRLLTDQQTALDMQLPYALLGNGMALVWTGPRLSRAR